MELYTYLWFLSSQFSMFLIGQSNLFNCLRPGGQRFHSRREERVDGLNVISDSTPQRIQKGIKELLDVVINGGLDWQGGHGDAVNFCTPVDDKPYVRRAFHLPSELQCTLPSEDAKLLT